MFGRETGEEGGLNAQRFVTSKFETLQLLKFNDSFSHSFDYASPFKKRKVTGANIIGWIKGRSDSNKYIVVSSHHDHLGVKNGEIYNGADDNASGTCALFSIAEYLKLHRPNCSFIFVAFDAEENGLLGSKHFLRKPPVPLREIVFNLNLDMISRAEKQEIFICGTSHYPEFIPTLSSVDSLSAINVVFGHDDSGARGTDDWTYSSDHGSFHRKGVPFIYLGVENHADYHQPTDDFEKIDKIFYLEAVRVSIRIIERIDKRFSSY
jgi:Zn-dependent M28 family amino/carboxypeptidase